MFPAATKIVDSAGNSWTISGGVISENGVPQTITHAVVVLLYYHQVIYQENSSCNWWSWTNNAWLATAKPAATGIPTCSKAVSSASSSSSSSSSGGGSGAASGAPAAAAAVGYNTQTFNSTALETSWFPFGFLSSNQPAGYAVQNSDGSIFLNGNSGNPFGGTISSAAHSASGDDWTGIAFGGGAYFEATLSFTGQGDGPYGNGGPAFWANDIEWMSQGPYNIQWPGYGGTAWSNTATYAIDTIVNAGGYYWISKTDGNVGHNPQTDTTHWEKYSQWVEVDFMEYDVKEYWYQNGIGNWTNFPGGKFGAGQTYYGSPGSLGSVPVAVGTDFSKPHRYGCLWVPATPTTQGYLKFYFDGVQTASPTFYWNYWDPANPNVPAPSSANHSAMSIIDQRHMALILGTGTEQPMTVYAVSVWQASTANNIAQ
jgi:hypothetical protein